MDFAPASLQETCLHKILAVSQFAGSHQWLALPQLLCTARLHQAMHAAGPEVEFVVLKSMLICGISWPHTLELSIINKTVTSSHCEHLSGANSGAY